MAKRSSGIPANASQRDIEIFKNSVICGGLKDLSTGKTSKSSTTKRTGAKKK